MNETDLEMEQGADLYSAAVPVNMPPSFKRWKAGGLDLFFYVLKKHYFHGINLNHVTTASSQGWLSLRWSTVCLFFHPTQNPGLVTSLKPQLRSPWQRAESLVVLGELLRNLPSQAPSLPWPRHRHCFSVQNQQVLATTVTEPWHDLSSRKDNYLAKFSLKYGPRGFSALGNFLPPCSLMVVLCHQHLNGISPKVLALQISRAAWIILVMWILRKFFCVSGAIIKRINNLPVPLREDVLPKLQASLTRITVLFSLLPN